MSWPVNPINNKGAVKVFDCGGLMFVKAMSLQDVTQHSSIGRIPVVQMQLCGYRSVHSDIAYSCLISSVRHLYIVNCITR